MIVPQSSSPGQGRHTHNEDKENTLRVETEAGTLRQILKNPSYAHFPKDTVERHPCHYQILVFLVTTWLYYNCVSLCVSH